MQVFKMQYEMTMRVTFFPLSFLPQRAKNSVQNMTRKFNIELEHYSAKSSALGDVL